MDDPALWISIVALVTSAYSAVSARRSAGAAERSAKAVERSVDVADQALTLEREHSRQEWVFRLENALPDPRAVTGLLGDLPSFLGPEWLQLLKAAADRNPRTPPAYFAELLEKHQPDWEAAAQRRRDE